MIKHLELQDETDKKIKITELVLFLFFGLFRKHNGTQFYGEPFHAIWGYMVCDKVIDDQQEMPTYHPHAKLKKAPNDSNDFKNLLFIAKDECYGTFKFCEELVLTDLEAIPYAKTMWKIDALPWFEYLKDKSVTMTYHPNTEKCFPAGKNYFQACQGYGQEFVVSPGVCISQDLNWENCSFCEILKNLEKIYPKKENNQ